MPQLDSIDHNAPFDWGRSSEYYAKFRDIYPASFYKKLRELGIGLPGQNILDLGTGTGVLPRAFHALDMQGGGARFTGADISPEQLAQARALSQGMDIEYVLVAAEEIDFPPGTFDAAMACQCFHYFDREKVMPKIHEVLKPGGRFAILSMIYLPYQSKIAMRSDKLVLKYNPKWTGSGYRRKNRFEQRAMTTAKWAKPMFKVENRVFYCEDIPFTRDSWHGRMMSVRGITASFLPGEKIAAFEAEHRTYLETLPERFAVPHQIMMLILRRQL
ncbi:MAG: class I SAM-dependent methyltransferase [Oscillospiraceae bacterium]|nr:class I SAM-dependent methyltransferase [Oscillospiraceae bacterium]